MSLRAILVCVDYADVLSITLPYNRHHFDEVMVVTTPNDEATLLAADKCGARTFQTNAFYDHGASFNKWKALEQGLDYFGRHGWLCIMDADVLWPREVRIEKGEEADGIRIYPPRGPNPQPGISWLTLRIGQLCTPIRRMREPLSIVPECDWKKFPIHRNVGEFAGYSQIFHAEDPALGPAPWHEVDWKHAGGADSFFQRKWPANKKIRPPFEVLHLGEAGVNWFGRSSPYVNGARHPEAEERALMNREIWSARRRKPDDPFAAEKIPI